MFEDNVTCRACLMNAEVLNSFDDRVEFDSEIKLMDIFFRVSGIVIDFNQTLQLTRICSECKIKLLKAYEFQIQVQSSEKLLSEYIQDVLINNSVKREEEQELGLTFDEASLPQTENNNYSFNQSEIYSSIKKEPPENKCENILSPIHKFSVVETQVIKSEEVVEQNNFSRKRSKRTEPIVKIVRMSFNQTFERRVITTNLIEPIVMASKTSKTNERQTKTETKKIVCNVCGNSFSKTYFRLHIRNHASEKPFQCETCGKSFVAKYLLTRHIRSHTGEKPFACTLCVKTFATSRFLVMHLRIHNNIRPYKCKVCHKGFVTSSAMKKHSLRHSKKKPYKCNICSSKFKSKSGLKNHRCKTSHSVDVIRPEIKDENCAYECFSGYAR